MNRKSLLSALQRPIAFHKIFAQISGGITSGLFLSQLFYWHDKGSDPDGWIYKNYREWEEETTMTRRELDTARKRLKAIAVIEEKKAGAPAKLFYRIDFDRLIALIGEFDPMDAANKDGAFRQTEMAHSAKLNCTNPPNSLLYTETTAEITASSADDEKPVDPFFTGQYRAIAREVVKQQKLSAAPRNFLEDGPWAELATETGRTNAMVFRHFKTYLEEIANVQGKRDPEAYAGAIANSLFNNPGSELACKPWIKFADHYRVHLCVPDVSPLEDSALGQNYSRFKNALDQFED
jgi:hypothetical protein